MAHYKKIPVSLSELECIVCAMHKFNSDGAEVAFIDEGRGRPVVLVHGFASNVPTNWVNTGWVKLLQDAGRRVVAFDNRGHGQSRKFYDPGMYGAAIMAEDARRLLDFLGIEKADFIGYSMGGRISAFMAINHPDRVQSTVIAGMGINLVHGIGGSEPIARALEAEDIKEIRQGAFRTFRDFADATGSDRKALAACIRSSREKIPPEKLTHITTPVLIAVGTEDTIAGSARELADIIPGAQVLDIPGRDHMKAVGDNIFKQGVVDFLS
jgi:pimeloyl-ACP methyl ester carboxylesterase